MFVIINQKRKPEALSFSRQNYRISEQNVGILRFLFCDL